MRAVVFAYHSMGVIGLEALRRHGVDLPLVLSHRDDPGEKCWFASVEEWCRSNSVPCECPEDVNQPAWLQRISACKPDMLFSFYYRRLLAPDLLAMAPQGGLNLHGSLLPAYRGRCPVNWVLVRGETETGVTLHHMVARADAGDIVGRESVSITPEDDSVTLYGKLEHAACVLLDRLLPLVIEGRAPREPQDEAAATTFGGRCPADGLIDWAQSAASQYDLVRAVTDPYPGAFSYLAGKRLVIWRAAVDDGAAILDPGRLRVSSTDAIVGCSGVALKLLDVSWEGQRLTYAELADALREYDGAFLTSACPP